MLALHARRVYFKPIASNVDLGVAGGLDQPMVRFLGVDLSGFDLASGRQILRGDTLIFARERLDGRTISYRLPYRAGGEPAAELAASPLVQATAPRSI